MLWEALHARSGRLGDRIAVQAPSGELTFEELWSEADRVAAVLRTEGVAPGTPVGLRLPNSPRFLIAFLALCRLDATIALLSPQYGPGELDAIASGVRLSSVVVAAEAEADGLGSAGAGSGGRGRDRRTGRAPEVQLGLDGRAEGDRPDRGERARRGGDARARRSASAPATASSPQFRSSTATASISASSRRSMQARRCVSRRRSCRAGPWPLWPSPASPPSSAFRRSTAPSSTPGSPRFPTSRASAGSSPAPHRSGRRRSPPSTSVSEHWSASTTAARRPAA